MHSCRQSSALAMSEPKVQRSSAPSVVSKLAGASTVSSRTFSQLEAGHSKERNAYSLYIYRHVYFARQFSYCQPLAPRIHCYSRSRFALATSPIHPPRPKSWLRAPHRRCTSAGRFATRLCTLARRRCLCFGSCSWCCLPRCSSCQHSVGTS